MMFHTHLAFAFLIGIFSISFLNPPNQILFLVLLLFASALPDVDSENSKVGSKVKIISSLFEHRGFFHSIFALLLFALLTVYLLNQKEYFFAVAIGYGSHLLGDMISKHGVAFFYPLTKKKLHGFMKVGGLFEIVLLVVFVALGFWKLLSF